MNICKRCSNIATGNILGNNGVSLAIFQNIENKDYVKHYSETVILLQY